VPLGFLRQGAKLQRGKVLSCADLRNQESAGNAEVFQVLVKPVDDRRCVVTAESGQLLHCHQIIVGLHQP